MKYLLMLLLLASCGGKKPDSCGGKKPDEPAKEEIRTVVLDPRFVGECFTSSDRSTFWKITGIDSDGYMLNRLILTKSMNGVEIVVLSEYPVSDLKLEEKDLVSCTLAERRTRGLK